MRMTKRPVQQTPHRRLRTAAKKSARYGEDEYFVEEPNVKLSRAFVVVLLLHVVAVGGIFAFSTLKDRQLSASATKKVAGDPGPSPTSAPPAGNSHGHSQPQMLIYKVKAGDTLPGIAAQFGLTTRDLEAANNLSANVQLITGRELIVSQHQNEKGMPSELQKLVDARQTTGKTASGSNGETSKFYTIQRGDNPAIIAKKFKITASELLRVNNIDDPKKLQVGQRLLIPTKVD